jgi:heme exporter protein A
MLKADEVGFDYGDKPVFDAVNLSFAAGLMHLQGENGAGKSTLLKLMAGLLAPSRGCMTYAGQLCDAQGLRDTRALCFVGHALGVNGLLSPRQHWLYDLHQPAHEFKQALDYFGLQGAEDMPCHSLSVGQQRRVAFLRLLVSPGRLWLLDEPFAGLDPKAMDGLTQLIVRHLHLGGSVVLTSHQSLPIELKPTMQYCL